MVRVFVKELKDGDSVNEIFLLADKQLRANRNANLYLLATLRDRTGIVSGLMWNVAEEMVQNVSAGDYVRVRGKVQLYQGGLQMIMTHIDHVPRSSCDEEDFQVQSQANAAPLLAFEGTVDIASMRPTPDTGSVLPRRRSSGYGTLRRPRRSESPSCLYGRIDRARCEHVRGRGSNLCALSGAQS